MFNTLPSSLTTFGNLSGTIAACRNLVAENYSSTGVSIGISTAAAHVPWGGDGLQVDLQVAMMSKATIGLLCHVAERIYTKHTSL